MAKSNVGIIAVPIDDIVENEVALRAVDYESEGYLGLVESIRNDGFNGAITVRPAFNADDGQPLKTEDGERPVYELIDGLHRWNAAKDAGLPTIPCQVKEGLDKEGVMVSQVMMNLHKIDTKPIQFTHQLQRLISFNPTLTIVELSQKIGKSPAFIHGRLALLKLDDSIQKLVDEGKITLSNALPLCKLPKEEQVKFIDLAMTKPPAEFVPEVNKRVKEIKEALKEGREAKPQEFSPMAALQKKADIEAELASLNVVAEVLKTSGAKTAAEGATAALAWALKMDAASVTVQKAKYDERKAAQAAAKKKRALDRAKKKTEEAAEAQAAAEAAIKEEAEASGGGEKTE